MGDVGQTTEWSMFLANTTTRDKINLTKKQILYAVLFKDFALPFGGQEGSRNDRKPEGSVQS